MKWILLMSVHLLGWSVSWENTVTAYCYQGWVQERGKCYRLFNTTVSWQQAKYTCDVMNSTLVTLNDITEQTFILQLKSTMTEVNHWIGFFRSGTSWRWLQALNTSIYNLNTTNISPGEDCAAITVMGIWNPTRCEHHLPYICESETNACMTSNGWFVFETQCLYLTTGLYNWNEARADCNRVGADLASVKPPYKDSSLLMSNGVTSWTWIGLKYDTLNSPYLWLDGSPSNVFQNNAVFQRTNNLKCGAIAANETTKEVSINGYSCDVKMQGLCEKRAVQGESTTTSVGPLPRKSTPVLSTLKTALRQSHYISTPCCTGNFGSTSTISQSSETDSHQNMLVLLAECLTGIDDEFIDDCIRDVFLSYNSICLDTYQQPKKNEKGLTNLYTIEFYKFVQHFDNFIERNMTFSLCMQNNAEAFVIVETILDQTYTRSNVTDSFHFNLEKLELHVRKAYSSSNRRDVLLFESHMTGCLVNEVHYPSTVEDIDVCFAVISIDEILPVDMDESHSTTAQHFLVSPILIVSAYNSGKKTTVGPKYTLAYHTTADIAENKHLNITQHEVLCAFYDTRERLWSTRGCQVLDDDKYTVTCRCNHTTSFGIIMKVEVYEMSKADEVALSVIAYIGCSVSMVTMFIALTVFTCIRSLNSERVFVHRNLCVAILCAQVVFLAAGKATRHKMVCRVTAVVLHYCFLSIFSWMLVEGLHLYTKVVQVFGTDNSRNSYYLCFGWGLPLVLVLISSVADWEGYGTETSCWLSIDRKTIWAFVGPAIAVIVVNLVILVMILRVVVSSSKNERNSKKDQIRAAIKAALFLLHLLGLTWIFGLLAVNRQLIVFEYIFSISNSLQGFFVFLFHCVLNTEVRQALRRVRERRAILNENIHTVSMSTSGSDTSSLAVEGTFRFRLSYNAGQRRCHPVHQTTFGTEVKTCRDGIKPNISATPKSKESDLHPFRRSVNNPVLKSNDSENLPLIYI